MALPLGKLTILVGAGLIGSVLAKEGRLPSFSDVVSGAFKIALKPIKQNDSASSTSKPRNDVLMAQVNSLRQELQLLASSGPVTIVTTGTAGGRRFGVVIVIVVVGYGYVWWKGWKLPDFMFATKRGLSDACNSVAKQLEEVYSSLKVTRRDLSSKLNESNQKLDEIGASYAETGEEVAKVREITSVFSGDLQVVTEKVQKLESRMGRMQLKQDETKAGVGRLLQFAMNAGNRFEDLIQDSPSSSSRPALEHPHLTPSRTASTPPVLSLEPPSSPAFDGFSEEGQDISGVASDVSTIGVSNGNVSPAVSNGNHATTEKQNVRSSGNLFSRTFSATQYFKFK